MAGHRRGTGKPTQRAARAERMRDRLTVRMAQATGPIERVGVAVDYLRSAVAKAVRTNTSGIDDVCDRAADTVLAAANQVLGEYEKFGRGRS